MVYMGSRGASDTTPQERYERLVELSPSAKYVFSTLEHHGISSQKELADQTLLPKRTVQYALDRLDQKGLLEKTVDASDARCRKYSSEPVAQPDTASTEQ